MKTTAFFNQYGIDELRIGQDADIRDREISSVEVCFGKGSDDAGKGYRVVFKLLDAASDAHRFISRIGPPPKCQVDWTPEGEQLGEAARQERVRSLISAIAGRVAKVYQEQSILNIQPVGKTFLLMGQTRFDVLADDGEGQLSIRLHRPEGASEAGLNANDLLDGLYTGLITRYLGSE